MEQIFFCTNTVTEIYEVAGSVIQYFKVSVCMTKFTYFNYGILFEEILK